MSDRMFLPATINPRRGLDESYAQYSRRRRWQNWRIKRYLQNPPDVTHARNGHAYVVGPHRTHAPVAGKHCGTLMVEGGRRPARP